MGEFYVSTLHKYRRRLVIMVKEPHPGRVKTRLAKDIGTIAAAWWFRHSAAQLIRRVRDPRWQVIIAVSPDTEGSQSRVWPADLMRMQQGSGGLGVRMAGLLANAPLGPVVIIGADIPGICPQHIERAFRELGTNEMVFGPARDGGFWLVGSKRLRPNPTGLFENTRWSATSTLGDVLRGLGGIRVGIVDTLSDVDTVADL